MNEEDILFIQEEYLGYITADIFTRGDRALARTKLEEGGCSKTLSRAILSLVPVGRTALRDTEVRVKQESLKETVSDVIRLVEAAKPGGVTVAVDASSTSTSKADSQSRATGKKMGDEIKVGRDVVNSAVGSHARFKARDVASYKNEVDTSTVDDEVKTFLKRIADAIETAALSETDAEDVKDDLAKFTAELEKPDKNPVRLGRLWGNIKAILPPVATFLSAAASVAKLIESAHPH